MRLHRAAVIPFLVVPVLAAAQGTLGVYEDRIAVEDVMARYVWVDSLDAEGYVAVFTEDAVIDANGSVSKGREDRSTGRTGADAFTSCSYVALSLEPAGVFR